MSIFLTESSRIIVQGMTGSEGMKHTRRMVAAGSKIVGGVNPRKAGEQVDGIPVFGSVADAVKETGADVSVVFVPPRFARGAVEESIDAAVPLVVRLDGNNADLGRRILTEAALPGVEQVDTMDGAAKRAAELAAAK